jgi:hypothetical protein
METVELLPAIASADARLSRADDRVGRAYERLARVPSLDRIAGVDGGDSATHR